MYSLIMCSSRFVWGDSYMQLPLKQKRFSESAPSPRMGAIHHGYGYVANMI